MLLSRSPKSIAPADQLYPLQNTMNKALYEVVFNIKEKNPETLLPELFELFGTSKITDFPTLSVLAEHALYYYQFTNLPNPLERRDLNNMYGYKYRFADFDGETEKI